MWLGFVWVRITIKVKVKVKVRVRVRVRFRVRAGVRVRVRVRVRVGYGLGLGLGDRWPYASDCRSAPWHPPFWRQTETPALAHAHLSRTPSNRGGSECQNKEETGTEDKRGGQRGGGAVPNGRTKK